MPKFRFLSQEELAELKKEFIDFLVLNGISAPDWEKIKANEPEKAEKIIELFSDMIFETILRKIKYIEYRDSHHLRVFHCLDNEIVLIAMEADKSEEIDFTNPTFLSSAMLTPPKSVKLYKTSKHYERSRELELFSMLQQGCLVTDDHLFNTLQQALIA